MKEETRFKVFVGPIIGAGSFSKVLLGNYNGKDCVIKTDTKRNILDHEYKIYQILTKDLDYSNYVLSMLDYVETNDDKRMLILQKGQYSLEAAIKSQSTFHFVKNKHNQYVKIPYFKPKTFYPIMTQLFNILKFIHQKGIIHQDIKPDNFIYHNGTFKLIDFGLSRFSSQKSSIRPYGSFIGSLRYCSIRTYEGQPISYRDDLESLIYMCIFCLIGYLPWQTSFNKLNKTKEYFNIWKYTPNPTLFKGLFKYARNLEFDKIPDYDHILVWIKSLNTDS